MFVHLKGHKRLGKLYHIDVLKTLLYERTFTIKYFLEYSIEISYQRKFGMFTGIVIYGKLSWPVYQINNILCKLWRYIIYCRTRTYIHFVFCNHLPNQYVWYNCVKQYAKSFLKMKYVIRANLFVKEVRLRWVLV